MITLYWKGKKVTVKRERWKKQKAYRVVARDEKGHFIRHAKWQRGKLQDYVNEWFVVQVPPSPPPPPSGREMCHYDKISLTMIMQDSNKKHRTYGIALVFTDADIWEDISDFTSDDTFPPHHHFASAVLETMRNELRRVASSKILGWKYHIDGKYPVSERKKRFYEKRGWSDADGYMIMFNAYGNEFGERIDYMLRAYKEGGYELL